MFRMWWYVWICLAFSGVDPCRTGVGVHIVDAAEVKKVLSHCQFVIRDHFNGWRENKIEPQLPPVDAASLFSTETQARLAQGTVEPDVLVAELRRKEDPPFVPCADPKSGGHRISWSKDGVSTTSSDVEIGKPTEKYGLNERTHVFDWEDFVPKNTTIGSARADSKDSAGQEDVLHLYFLFEVWCKKADATTGEIPFDTFRGSQALPHGAPDEELHKRQGNTNFYGIAFLLLCAFLLVVTSAVIIFVLTSRTVSGGSAVGPGEYGSINHVYARSETSTGWAQASKMRKQSEVLGAS